MSETVGLGALKKNLTLALCNEMEKSLNSKDKEQAKFGWLNFYFDSILRFR